MAQFARPDSDITKGNWDDPNGNNNNVLYDDIEEETPSDSDYIESPDDPSSESCEVGLSDVTDPESSSDHTIRVRFQAPESGGGQPSTIDFTIALMEGATERASWTEQPDPPTTWAEASYTLSSGEADSISDYTDLRLRFTANKTGGARTTRIEVSWAEFECPSGVVIVPLTGSASSASDVPTSELKRTRKFTGSALDSVSNVPDSTLKRTRGLTGEALDSVSSADAVLERLLKLIGSASAISNVPAVGLKKSFKLTGEALDSVSSADAELLITRIVALTGSALDSQSQADAEMKIWRGLSGSASSISSADALILLEYVLTGSVSGISSADAELTVLKAFIALTGSASSISSADADLKRLRRLAGSALESQSQAEAVMRIIYALTGSASSASLADAILTLLGGTIDLTGSASSVSSADAVLKRLMKLDGEALDSVSSALADLTKWKNLTGSALSESTVSAIIKRLRRLSGTASSESSASAELYQELFGILFRADPRNRVFTAEARNRIFEAISRDRTFERDRRKS